MSNFRMGVFKTLSYLFQSLVAVMLFLTEGYRIVFNKGKQLTKDYKFSKQPNLDSCLLLFSSKTRVFFFSVSSHISASEMMFREEL